VIVISIGSHASPNTGTHSGTEPARAVGSTDEGRRIPGTDYVVRLSDQARRTDAEVRAHEQAHQRTLGPYAAGPITYSTTTGPGGESVVTGGSIGVDLDPVPGNPRATLRKARVVMNAAYAPGDPSGADMRVAADAYRLAMEAREEIQEQRRTGRP
jgi:hypothetical protein